MSKGYLSKKERDGRVAYLCIVFIAAHPSELDCVIFNPTVEFTNLGFVQLLALHYSLNLFLVQIVVLVEVDRYLSDLLLVLLEECSDSCLALAEDILHLFIDH